MRLLEVKQALLEARSITDVLISEPERAAAFLQKIKDKTPFPVKVKGSDNIEIVAAPSEYKRLQALIAAGNLKGQKLIATDGESYNLNNLVKTKELGGKEAETIAVKPTDVFAGDDIDPEAQNVIKLLSQAGAFPVSELNNQIQSNAALDKVGPVGQGIKEIAQQISEGQEPTIPDYLSPEQKKAIELYAGEYLGVLSIFNHVAKFDKRAEFDEFLGMDLGQLMLYFPRSQSNPLADSFAIQNKKDGHSLKISSKAAGKGAAPSLEGLKIPAHVRENKAFATEVAFFDEARDPKYTAFSQAFGLMNWMFKNMPDMINEKFYPYLPWTQEWIDEINISLKENTQFPKSVMNNIISTIPKGRPKGTDGGVIWYAVISDVLKAVNAKNALPQLKPVVLETLGYNFMQVYTQQAGNKLKTKVFWPAKIDGKVQLKTKGYAGNPNFGKLGFQVSD
jgi:curved DNA-binding protein CbpA